MKKRTVLELYALMVKAITHKGPIRFLSIDTAKIRISSLGYATQNAAVVRKCHMILKQIQMNQ